MYRPPPLGSRLRGVSRHPGSMIARVRLRWLGASGRSPTKILSMVKQRCPVHERCPAWQRGDRAEAAGERLVAAGVTDATNDVLAAELFEIVGGVARTV